MKDDDQRALELRKGSREVVEGAAVDLQRALQQKTALLHEVDHRVKNNLQLMSSLLQLQARRASDPAVRAALQGALERVEAIATVHRRLFQNDDIDRFDVAAFLEDLVTDALGASGRRDIRAELDLERIDVPAARAAPLALLVNELLRNAIRHAFPDGRPGVIRVSIRREGEHFRIEIADNGVGLAKDGAPSGFGQTIVGLLREQLRAECVTTTAEPGVRTLIRLPVNGHH